VLDEPTNGMDPQGTREIRHLIRDLAADGTTVFLSSHLLAEIEQVCTHVAMMSQGRLVTQGRLADLAGATTAQARVVSATAEAAAAVLRARGLQPEIGPDAVTVALADQRPEDLVAALVHAGVGVREFSIHRPSLEDVFVQLTGEGFDLAR
jgi:ABC-2 type transport system ATP-binding protein